VGVFLFTMSCYSVYKSTYNPGYTQWVSLSVCKICFVYQASRQIYEFLHHDKWSSYG